jgi:hypothetical protein
MEIMNKFSYQMTIENGYGSALCVKSPPICSRKIHQILQQLSLLGWLGRIVIHTKKLKMCGAGKSFCYIGFIGVDAFKPDKVLAGT